MKFTHLLYTIAATIAVQLCSPLYAEIVNDGSETPVEAVQLATAFFQDKPTADVQYRDKQIAVKGTICKIEQGFGNSEKVLICIYLKTAPGLPLVKLEVTNIDEAWKQAWGGGLGDAYYRDHPKVRITNRNTLEVLMVTNRIRTWLSIAKCGDAMIAKGSCNGKMIDVVVSNASI